MNKTAIKNFAIWARRKLISDITYKAGLIGINEQEILHPLSISTDNVQFFDIGTGKPTEISSYGIEQRNALVNKIREKESISDYKTAYQFVIEEVAYTWFNRLIAIRFMEVNDYLPSRIRVLSSETPGKSEPDMVTAPFDTDMDFSPYETDRIIQLKEENKLDELFRMLFIKQCNKLNEALPELFEETSDYTEFLLNISFTDKDGIVSHLVNDIEESDFTEAVEIIGWLYQYYNTEPKEEVFALLKKNVKITKERIPAATQLFTPDWIVRYMVENSLGRLWVEGHPNEGLKSEWKYYLEEAEQEEEVNIELDKIKDEYKKLNPEDIKIIDPCMGSGHILVYTFDVLMQIYESQGYTQRDAAQSITRNNLYGLDIDDRAYQLAYFAVMMKARKYDRRFLTRGISPKLYSMKESNNIQRQYLQYFGNSLDEVERDTAIQQMEYLLDVFHDAKEYGSILNVDVCDWELLKRFVDDYSSEEQISIESFGAEQLQNRLKEIVAIAEAMAQKYDVVVTNPPYMGSSGMNPKVSKYVKKNYPDSKSDLFAVFIEKCMQMTKDSRYTAMITQHAFMFLSSYKKLRFKLLSSDFVNMAHLGARAFEEIGGEVVQTTSFVLRTSNIENYEATYVRLVDYNSQQEKENAFIAKNDLHTAHKENFSKIPGLPIAYWVSEKFITLFKLKSINSSYDLSNCIQPGDSNQFLCCWFEIDSDKLNNNWKFVSKGGPYRKWYGNIEYVLNYGENGEPLLVHPNTTLRTPEKYFQNGFVWSRITTGAISFRKWSSEKLVTDAGPILYSDNVNLFGFLNTKVANTLLSFISPTINYQVGNIGSLPLIDQIDVEKYVNINVEVAKLDWDSFETSFDFITHPLIKFRMAGAYAWGDAKPISRISSAFKAWEIYAEGQFNQLKANEEDLNRMFIDICGLQDEISPEVEDKDVTVRKSDLQRDIKSFISYAVGCMFGRYSLDVEGLAYAGGDWDTCFCEAGKYTTFIPDNDNVIPITDEEYFKDDIVGLFVAFVKKVYGTEALEVNLDFIAKALGNKGDTSREAIRNYFLKDFFKDHCKTYSVTGSGKRPIYWLYDSGKQNGFKALIYMHRYNADTTGIVRVDYLHKMQKIYMSEIERMQDMAENSTQAREITQAEKRKEKLIKQLKETKEYDEKIAHIALSRIDIDFDDGVKVNYEKVQTSQGGKKLDILAKI